MSVWPHPIIDHLHSAVGADDTWKATLQDLSSEGPFPLGVHLAVLVEPYLRLILRGDKTVESRFARRRYPPYGRVRRGDIILLKKAGGPIVGIAQATEVSFHECHDGSWQVVRDAFGRALCAVDDEFWQRRVTASYATLVGLARVRRLAPSVDFHKRDRRGWVVLQTSGQGEEASR